MANLLNIQASPGSSDSSIPDAAWIAGAFSPDPGMRSPEMKAALAAGRLYTPGTPEAGMDYASGFLRGVLGHIGITDVEIVLAGGSQKIRRGLVSVEDHITKYEVAVKEMALH